MNRDIVKLRNYFDNLNLRNDIVFKNAMKKIENIKLKDWKQTSKFYNNKTSFYLNNDNSKKIDFQIKENVRTYIQDSGRSNQGHDKMRKQINKRLKNKPDKYDLECANDKQGNKEEESDKDPDPITFNKENDSKTNLDFNYNIKIEDGQKIENYDLCDLTKPESELNEFHTDLQSLLILMAINSKANENKGQNTNCMESFHSVTKDQTLQTMQSCKKSDAKISELLCVIPLRTEEQNRYDFLSRKVIDKWKKYVQEKKQVKQREQVLKSFFEKLAEKKSSGNQSSDYVKKAKSHIKDYNTYQHRYKVQQNIIALQKMKLEEQTKMIEQLKYNRIIESSKESLEALRNDVSKTYYQIDPQLKPKIKCLTNELKIRELDVQAYTTRQRRQLKVKAILYQHQKLILIEQNAEPTLVLHCLKVPQFLQRMEKRAREREEKHAIIRERRRQMEEERVRLKQQAELAKLEMDKEEKAKRIKELRVKRKREKIENIRRKKHAERMRALVVMADLHYEKTLISKYGINSLRRLIEIKRDNIEKAKLHYMFQFEKNVFLHWMWHTEDMWFERNYKAENLSRRKILSRAFNRFKHNYNEYKLKMQVAEDYYDLYVTQLVFRTFREGIRITQYEFKIKWNKAVLYHNTSLLFKSFTCWRTLPALNALKREQEVRKLRWREKVLQVVPDYNPPDE